MSYLLGWAVALAAGFLLKATILPDLGWPYIVGSVIGISIFWVPNE